MATGVVSRAGGDSGGAIGLDDLIALNDEIAALARAGLPLECGLLGFGAEVPGRLGTLATTLGQRLQQGQSLPEALAAEGNALPPTYRAVVEAGLRSGRLPAALEDLAGYARGFAELRRVIAQALLYPLIVLLFAYGLFLAFLTLLLPRLLDAFATFRIPVPGLAHAMRRLGQTALYWGPIVPLGLLALVGLWVWTGRAGALRIGAGLRWVPGLGPLLADWRASNFAGWLALLLGHGVPLPEAAELAGEASGDPALKDAAGRLAQATRRGEPAGQALRAASDPLPPLLGWLVVAGQDQGTLAPTLRQAAELYRRRALRRAETLRTLLPTFLLLLIGGVAALAYTVLLFVPWTTLLQALTRPDA